MNEWPASLERSGSGPRHEPAGHAASTGRPATQAGARIAARPATSVCIALSTHNGSAFLPAQLKSIVGQSHDDWMILWRDDDSADDTSEVMRAFARTAGAGRVLDANDRRGRLGITASFMALVRRAPPDRMLAFADQDDVWLPDKLARGVAALKRVEPERPALYCARQVLVDATLHRLGESASVSRPFGFPQSLTQNIATGCTVMLNPAAVRLLTAMRAPPETVHDWWSYLVVTAAGGEVLIDDTPTVLYRQHLGNAVGVKLAFWPRAFAALRRGPGAFMTAFRAHVSALEEQHDLLDVPAQESIAVIASALRGRGARRIAALRLCGLRRQTFAETVIFWLWFLIG